MKAIRTVFSGLIPKSGFIRGVSVLTAGTIAGQFLVLLATPLLTRFYSPEDFGLLAVFSSILFPLSVISSLRYQLAIPLPEADIDAAALTILSATLVVCLAILLAVLLPILSSKISVWTDVPDIENYLWLLPLGFLVLGLYEVLNYWAVRKGEFTAIAKTKIFQSTGMISIQIAGATLGPGSLLVGQIIGHGAGAGGLASIPFRKDFAAFKSVNLPLVFNAAKRYRNFPLISTWGSVFNTAGAHLPPLLFAAFYSQGIAGFYALAYRILAGPLELITKSIAKVFFFNAPEMQRQGRLGEMVLRIYSALAALAAPPAIILAFSGADLFSILFGEQWIVAGKFAQWMSPWLYFMMVSSPLTMVFTVREKLLHNTGFQIFMLLIRVGALIVGAMYGDFMLALVLFALSSALCYLALLLIIISISGNSWISAFVPTLREVTIGALVGLPLFIDAFVFKGQYVLIGFLASMFILVFRYGIFIKKYRSHELWS